MTDVSVVIRIPERPGDKAVLQCPICGCDSIHMHRVSVQQSCAIATAEADTVTVQKSRDHEPRRGSVVTLAYECEDGHGFIYRYSFHKGTTSVELDAQPKNYINIGQELWRD